MAAPLLADPERLLALSYAPASSRDALALLWQLDERLGTIAATAREPTIGAIRLMWWRDALAGLDDADAPVPAEPLLSAVATILLPAGLPGTALADIEEGWAALLEQAVPDAGQMAGHAERRGGALFALSAALLGSGAEDVAQAGEGWALAELGHRLSNAGARRLARRMASERLTGIAIDRWPVMLRPLGLLVVLARQDAAMPAGTQRRQGSPKRLFRALAYRVSGR